MVERVGWKDAISGVSTLVPEGGTGPQIMASPPPKRKISRFLDTVVNSFSVKNSKFDATRYQILRLKCTKFDFHMGSAPDTGGFKGAMPPPKMPEVTSK